MLILVIVEFIWAIVCFWWWCDAVFWGMPKSSEELLALYPETYRAKEWLVGIIPVLWLLVAAVCILIYKKCWKRNH